MNSEFRQDLTTKDWVLISPKRAGRPYDFKSEPATPEDLPEISDECPFCDGKKNDTPTIIAQYPKKGAWKVRVVPNKFNVLVHSAEKQTGETCDFYCTYPASGDHEVIITFPHNKPVALLDLKTVDLLLLAYLERIKELSTHEDVRYLHIIQNHGAQAGASLIHPHSQIFTTPFVPERIAEELNGTRRYYEDNRACLYCDIIAYEQKQKVRVVYETDDFLVITPYAAKVPYQLRVLPKRHASEFSAITEAERKNLGAVLKEALARLYDRLQNPAYNYYIHTLPFFHSGQKHTQDYDKFYHWHLVIVPRFSKFAGFELGTEVYVNTVAPEQAAEELG